MLQITISEKPAYEFYDERKGEFINMKGHKSFNLQLEHSLIAVAKWEAKWHKSFTSTNEKTSEEFLDYIRCMTLTKNVNPEVYDHITTENLAQINAYIQDPMTATTVRRKPGKGPSRKIITAEQIYSWMIDCEIPFECAKWHLNRLLTFIEVRNAQADPGKKMSPKSILKSNSSLNAARRSAMHSKG